MKYYLVDPPSGWKYGFPKACSAELVEDKTWNMIKWCVEQGYPQSEVDYFGENFYCGMTGPIDSETKERLEVFVEDVLTPPGILLMDAESKMYSDIPAEPDSPHTNGNSQFTQEQIDFYLENPDLCPTCKSDFISQVDLYTDPMGNTTGYTKSCDLCHTSWNEIHEIKTIIKL